MIIECIGGPHDGNKIEAIDLERHARAMVLKTSTGTRRFVYLPEPVDWRSVLGGRRRVDDSAIVHYYELIHTSHGLRLVHDAGREHLWQSVAHAIRDMEARGGGGGVVGVGPPERPA